MGVSDSKHLKELESDNAKLKKLLANSMLEVDAMCEVRLGE
jgi:putative transposase